MFYFLSYMTKGCNSDHERDSKRSRKDAGCEYEEGQGRESGSLGDQRNCTRVEKTERKEERRRGKIVCTKFRFCNTHVVQCPGVHTTRTTVSQEIFRSKGMMHRYTQHLYQSVGTVRHGE